MSEDDVPSFPQTDVAERSCRVNEPWIVLLSTGVELPTAFSMLQL